MNGGEARAWLYAIGWLGGGIVSGLMLASLVWVLTDGPWNASTQAQRLDILGTVAIGLLVLMGLVMLGLSMRNAIRNIKGSAGPLNFEANRDKGEA